MKRRYCDYMKAVQPSDAFLSRLEGEMLRELRRKRRPPQTRALTAAAACAAVLAAAFFGVRAVNPPPDVISQPPVSSAATATTLSTDAPPPTPTASASPAPEASPMPSAVYPSDDVRLELEMSDEGAFLSSNITDTRFNLFQDHLAGSSTHGSSLVEICQSAELNSVVIAPLYPGTAYWPLKGEGSVVTLTNQKGKEVGYAERVQYLDEATNTLREGWKHTIHAADPLPEAPDNPVEEIQLPGKIKAEYARLLYGRSANAPEVAILEKDQYLAIGHRVGNWLYVSTEPFSGASQPNAVGWLHITEAVGLEWRSSFKKVDLLADKVNLRESPDGKVIAVLPKETVVEYAGATVPGKSGDWHYVFVTGTAKADRTDGYVSADYTKLNTFRLSSELDMDGVVSAALKYSDHGLYGTVEQTVTGEKLNLLLERLKNAYSETVYSEVCGEGSAFITLTYEDGRTVSLPVSADSCTQVRHGAVTYDLKTDAERTERFLNDGGTGLEDILGPIFDEIFSSAESASPLQMSADATWNNPVPLGICKQMLGLTGGLYPLEVRSEPAAGAPVIATLQPGTASWPTYANQVRLDDRGYFEEIRWWDDESKQLETGWMLVLYDSGTKDDPISPLEDVSLPGRVVTADAPMRYGPSEEAPTTVGTMSAGQRLYLCARDGDWIFAALGDWPAPDFCGWVHVSDVEALQVRESLNRIDLLADEVEIFGEPDGSRIAVMTPEKAQSGFISYMGTTLPTETGSWHCVGYRERYEDDTSYGFVRADQTQIYTFTLADELPMDGAVSASLVCSEYSPFGAAEQTVEGDKLSALIALLSSAYSKEVYRPFSNEGALTLRLTFEGGRTETLVLDSDGEPHLRFGDVTYDLRQEAVRAGDFLNGGKTLLSDVLSPIFDEIKVP